MTILMKFLNNRMLAYVHVLLWFGKTRLNLRLRFVRRWLQLSMTLLLLLGLIELVSFNNLEAIEIKPDEFVNTSSLKRGDILTGLTRIDGNELVEFKMRIVAIMKNRNPDADTIMGEVLHERIKEVGVFAGMSGSPVYYQNKLVGAVAFTTSFSKTALAGITTIHNMLPIFDHVRNGIKQQQTSKKTAMTTAKMSTISKSPAFLGMNAVQVPLSFGGNVHLDKNKILKLLANMGSSNYILASLGRVEGENKRFANNKAIATSTAITPNSGSDVDSKKANSSPIQAGDSCALVFVEGDMQIAATGTVTYVSNDYVLAMGHPIANIAGKLEVPFYKAKVDVLVPSYNLSYKLSSLEEEIGVFVQDRASGIAGILGKKAKKIPISVHLKTEVNHKTLNYRVTADKNFFNQMATLVLANSFFQHENYKEKNMLSFRIAITTDYQDKVITLQDVLPGITTAENIFAIAQYFQFILSYLQKNVFLPVNVQKIEIELNSRTAYDLTVIKSIELEKKKYRPGETVRLNVELQSYRGPSLSKQISLTLPKYTLAGKYLVMVSSGFFYRSVDANISPAKYQPANIEQFFELVQSSASMKTLMVWMFTDTTTSMVVQNNTYRNLPFYQAEVLANTRQSAKVGVNKFLHKKYELASPVVGQASIYVVVDDEKF